MFRRWPNLVGTLKYAAAWLLPWREVFPVRLPGEDLTFLVHRRDAIGRHIAKYGGHKSALTLWIARHLSASPAGIFIDIGANLGWHVVHAAKQAAVETVVAFEPDPFNAWLLDRNLSINGVGNVIVCGCALGAGPGVARLYRYKPSNLGRHSLIADYGRGDSKLVPVLDLDRALANLALGERRVIAIKIDVEGYEPAVIEGATATLARADAIVLEYSPSLSRKANLSTEAMVDQLRRCGLKPFSLGDDGALSPVETEKLLAFEGQMDVVWTRQ